MTGSGVAGRRVLIVEDEALVAMMVEDALTDAGYEVCGVAANAPKAIDLARACKPEVALVDIQLSPGDGRDVARHLIERYGTAIVFATAYHEDLARASLVRAHLCLPKPYNIDDVQPALEAAWRMANGGTLGDLPRNVILVGAR